MLTAMGGTVVVVVVVVVVEVIGEYPGVVIVWGDVVAAFSLTATFAAWDL